MSKKPKNSTGMADVIQHYPPNTPELVLTYPWVLFVCQEKDLPPIPPEVFYELSDEHRLMLGEIAKAWLVSSGRWAQEPEQKITLPSFEEPRLPERILSECLQ